MKHPVSRQDRRFRKSVVKARRSNYVTVANKPNYEHPAACSCWMCGNPRHFLKGKDALTVQEQAQYYVLQRVISDLLLEKTLVEKEYMDELDNHPDPRVSMVYEDDYTNNIDNYDVWESRFDAEDRGDVENNYDPDAWTAWAMGIKE